MRIILALALTLLTACYADNMLAPPRVESTFEIREVRPVRLQDVVFDIDGQLFLYPQDSIRLSALDARDIESLTVYKGTAAARLYPSLHRDVVVVTTKRPAHSTPY